MWPPGEGTISGKTTLQNHESHVHENRSSNYLKIKN